MDRARIRQRSYEPVGARASAVPSPWPTVAGNAAMARWVARQRAPLARTEIEGIGDTADDRNKGNIEAYLKWCGEMDLKQLLELQNRIRNDKHNNWQHFTDHIHSVLGARHLLLSAGAKGNVSQATVTVCGRIVGVFEGYEAGHKDVPLTPQQQEYSIPPPQFGANLPARHAPTQMGKQLSQRDSEVRLLGDIDTQLQAVIPQVTQGQVSEEPRIELRITSTHGACNECKARLEQLVQNVFRIWVTRFGADSKLDLVFFYRYPEGQISKTRKNARTIYGWRDRNILRQGDAPIYEVSEHLQEYKL